MELVSITTALNRKTGISLKKAMKMNTNDSYESKRILFKLKCAILERFLTFRKVNQ